MKFAARIAYAGTRFCGWQRQRGSAALGAPSIQETLENALNSMTGETVRVVGSGRTDSGVHAGGQVGHFRLESARWTTGVLERGLNSLLPNDIRILGVKRVPPEFHAQRSALRKQYSYFFQQGPSALPHVEPFSWWIRKRLDLENLRQAAADLVGEHDFLPFQSSGAKPGPTVRRILEAEVSWHPLSFPSGMDCQETWGWVRIRLLGTGFLKQMVRGIAGTLLQIGEGRRDPSDVRMILETKDRRRVGPTAPGRALWLERVWYDGLEW